MYLHFVLFYKQYRNQNILVYVWVPHEHCSGRTLYSHATSNTYVSYKLYICMRLHYQTSQYLCILFLTLHRVNYILPVYFRRVHATVYFKLLHKHKYVNTTLQPYGDKASSVLT